MLSLRSIALVLLAAVTLVSCRRDPATVKKQYLESGNKYFERGRYKEAMIQYQNAIKVDQRFGPARFKLAETYMKLTPINVTGAYKEYDRAVGLLAGNQAYQDEYYLTMVKLSDIFMTYVKPFDTAAQDRVETYVGELRKKDPNSYDAFRLLGELMAIRAELTRGKGSPEQTDLLFANALENLKRADAVKPGELEVSMYIARILVITKHPIEAEAFYRRAIDKDKTSYLAYIELYRTYMSEEKRQEAEAILKEGAAKNPTNSQYLEWLAYHYMGTGRRDDMASVLQQIRNHAKDWPNVYRTVGDFYARIGDAESALREYRQGVTSDAKNKSVYQHSIVEILLRQGKRAEAAEVNNQILKENPKDPDSKSLQATFLLDSGDVRNALTQLQQVVTSSPDNAYAQYQLGRAFLASGQQNAQASAKLHFQKAIELRPDMLLPRLGLAELQVNQGEFDAALMTLKDILAKDPNNTNARLIQSQALLGQKKYGESDSLLSSMSKTNPTSPDVWYQMGLSALNQGHFAEAEAAFQRSYELNPNNARGLLGVVDAKTRAGKTDEAMGVLQAESKKAPNRLDLLLLMGITARNQNKFDDSVRYFQRVLDGVDKKANVRADLYLQIADSQRRKGDREASLQSLGEARKILPENEGVLSSLGLVLDQAGKRSDARSAYEACLKVNPNNVVVLNNLAYLMAETNSDLDVALNYAQKAKALVPNSTEIGDTYGWILLKKGLAVNAIPIFQDLVNRAPGQATYRFHLAKAYNMKGDPSRAAVEAREALKLSPSTSEQQEIQAMLSGIGK